MIKFDNLKLSIRKRDGRITEYDKNRIADAIFAAAKAVGGDDRVMADKLADIVTAYILLRYDDKNIPDVEDVQDLVEKILIDEGHAKTAKAYILYREQRNKMREAKRMLMNVESTIDGYLERSDWRVNENSNSDYSLSGLLFHASSSVMSHYTLKNVYPQEVANAHVNGDFHIHDLGMGIAGYCAGWSLKQLLLEGFNGVEGKVASGPSRHFDTALGQMINFLGTLQNEWAGAMAFSSFDTYLAPYVRKDGLNYEEVRQAIQQFVFNLNVASRWGGQTPFTNLTFDWTIPEDMKEENIIWGGEMITNEKYKDYQNEVDMINKAFIEVMMEGDMKGRIFTFPIPTYNITRDFDWESENAMLLFDMTSKYGTPYFQNFINSDLKPSDVRSMCCRLQMDLRQLRKKTGGLFGSGESTGSIGVVTINLPRIGYIAKTKKEFFEKLGSLMDIAQESLEIKRKAVNNNLENGLMPYTKRYLGTLEHHFSTIGLVGMNETLLNFMGKNIVSKDGSEFAAEILSFMRERITQYQEETGNIYNLEATPAEGTSYKLARIDKQKYPDIITAGESEPYYTNSSQLPVGYTDDIFEALDLQDKLQTKYTGGTVFHGFLSERLENAETCGKLVKTIAYKYHLPYFTLTPTFSICPDDGYIAGEHFECPICGNETEVYSRVVGYHRPIKNWNKGKKEEYKDRKVFLAEKGKKYFSDNMEDSKEENVVVNAVKEEKKQENIELAKDGNVKFYYFYQDNCPGCIAFSNYFKKYENLNLDKVNVKTDEGMDLAQNFGIQSTPTIVIMNQENKVECVSTNLEEINSWIESSFQD